MPLDAATRQLAQGLDREVQAARDREAARAQREERLRWDSVSRIVTWETKRGEVVGRWFGEVVATYVPQDRILRWSWAGRDTPSHAELIAREGGDRGVTQLSSSVVDELDEGDALDLAELGIVLARGHGMHVHRGPGEVEVVGLFDTARPRDGALPNQYSVPPPMVARSQPPGRVSIPPPAASVKIREPAKAILVPVATAVLQRLTKAAPTYRQALFVIVPEPLQIALTIIDGAGVLHSVDLPPTLLEASARMVEADRADGNGRWRKLSARITPKPDGGASLAVDVL